MDKRFYVYEHIRPDNNTCFYVGKGTGDRAYKSSRNEHHDRIVKKYGMIVKIIKDGLTEQEAYDLQRETILHYVFDLGYGIDIPEYRGNDDSHALTNANFGGAGVISGLHHTDGWKKQHSEDMKGEKNPMYGVNLWETYSEEKQQDIKDRLSKHFSGEGNPQFGVSPSQRMDSKSYERWHKSLVNRLNGSTNPNAKNVYLYDNNWNFLYKFDSIGDCIDYMRTKLDIEASTNSIRGLIGKLDKTGGCYKNQYRFDIDR